MGPINLLFYTVAEKLVQAKRPKTVFLTRRHPGLVKEFCLLQNYYFKYYFFKRFHHM